MALRFGVDRQHFENEENVISLNEFSSNTNTKWKKKTIDYCVFKFIRRKVASKSIWCAFRLKKQCIKFLRPSEEGLLISNSVQDKGKLYTSFDWKGEKRRCSSRQNIFVFDRSRCNTGKVNIRDNLHESTIQEISPVRVYTMYAEQILKSLLQLQQFSSNKNSTAKRFVLFYDFRESRKKKLIHASWNFHKNEYD